MKEAFEAQITLAEGAVLPEHVEWLTTEERIDAIQSFGGRLFLDYQNVLEALSTQNPSFALVLPISGKGFYALEKALKAGVRYSLNLDPYWVFGEWEMNNKICPFSPNPKEWPKVKHSQVHAHFQEHLLVCCNIGCSFIPKAAYKNSEENPIRKYEALALQRCRESAERNAPDPWDGLCYV